MCLCESSWQHTTVHTGEKYSFRLQDNNEWDYVISESS